MNRRTRAGTGILDVGDGNPLDSHRPQRDLAPNQLLPLHVPLTGVRELHRFEIGDGAIGVDERGGHRFSGEVFHRAVEQLAERRHADADDVDALHGTRLGARQLGKAVEYRHDLLRPRIGEPE